MANDTFEKSYCSLECDLLELCKRVFGKNSYEIAFLDIEEKKQSLILDGIKIYTDLLTCRKNLKYGLSCKKMHEEKLQYIKQQSHLKRSNVIDLEDARLDLMESSDNYNELLEDIALKETSFRNFFGFSPRNKDMEEVPRELPLIQKYNKNRELFSEVNKNNHAIKTAILKCKQSYYADHPFWKIFSLKVGYTTGWEGRNPQSYSTLGINISNTLFTPVHNRNSQAHNVIELTKIRKDTLYNARSRFKELISCKNSLATAKKKA